MRLSDFILAHIEPILVEWEGFAQSIWSGGPANPGDLRDHAEQILRAIAQDMKSIQTPRQQSEKSKGHGKVGEVSNRMAGASSMHAADRVGSGFALKAVVSEYRALRASVIRRWNDSLPDSDPRDVDDLTRFNESIDQLLTAAIASFTERLEWSRQMFLAVLGHDLRNPLTAIRLSSEVMSQSGKLDSEYAALTSNIAASAVAMGRLINDLLDFAGAELGGVMPVSPEPMDLKTLCREVLVEMRAAHPNREFKFAAHGDLTGAWDATRLRQVLSNLLGNAVQHGAADDPIELSASDEGSEVRLTVHNHGTPIAPEILGTIFQPLVRAPMARDLRKKREGGIGLGLYIVRAVISAHGGSIDVKSEPGSGTVFTAHLPRRRTANAAGNKPSRADVGS